jgi:hypothetical protein
MSARRFRFAHLLADKVRERDIKHTVSLLAPPDAAAGGRS